MCMCVHYSFVENCCRPFKSKTDTDTKIKEQKKNIRIRDGIKKAQRHKNGCE